MKRQFPFQNCNIPCRQPKAQPKQNQLAGWHSQVWTPQERFNTKYRQQHTNIEIFNQRFLILPLHPDTSLFGQHKLHHSRKLLHPEITQQQLSWNPDTSLFGQHKLHHCCQLLHPEIVQQQLSWNPDTSLFGQHSCFILKSYSNNHGIRSFCKLQHLLKSASSNLSSNNNAKWKVLYIKYNFRTNLHPGFLVAARTNLGNIKCYDIIYIVWYNFHTKLWNFSNNNKKFEEICCKCNYLRFAQSLVCALAIKELVSRHNLNKISQQNEKFRQLKKNNSKDNHDKARFMRK